MMQRFPDGIEKDGFYQKSTPDYFPDWIETVRVQKEGGTVEHVLCDNKATLIYLANQGTLVFHTWLSLAEALHKPDKMVIDLDPPGSDFGIVKEGAEKVKSLLDEVGIHVFLMTTGSSGLHIHIPLDASADFDASRKAGKVLSDALCEAHPDLFTDKIRKDKREGKLFVDIQRNAYAQTSIAPFSLRPFAEAPVATPLSWDELGKKGLDARSYTLGNIRKRLAEKEDPWKGMRRHAISVRSLKKKLAG
jgi:bifunctional non-homologous end joining protein LigD